MRVLRLRGFPKIRMSPAPVIMAAVRVFAILVLGFIGATFLAGFRPTGAAVWYAQTVISVAAVLGGLLVRERMRGARRELPAREGYRLAWRVLRTGPLHIRSYLVVALTLPFYIACFTAWKMWIGYRVPFTWDAEIAAAGRWLHGGRHAWEWIQPAIVSPIVSHALTATYAYGWTIAFHAVAAWAALTNRPRYLVATVMAWPVCGIGMAAAMMSAGPAFYGAVVRPDCDPYAPLMSYLHGIGSPAEYWQRYLWDVYVTHRATAGSGISAMPSMHLVMATLYACAVWELGRPWRVAGVCFVLVMQIGAVHSGWHYSLDGYAGIIAALGVWWTTGRLGVTGSEGPTRVAAFIAGPPSSDVRL
jgi:PAP2 superfamily protein